MAFIQNYGDGGDDTRFFNVSHNVGARATNYWTDIMLVQYFISYIYNFSLPVSSPFKASAADIRNLPDPNRDFKNLKKTETWVRRYQKDANRSGVRIYQDGRVDRMFGAATPTTHSVYTIFQLNMNFADFVEESGVESWQEWALEDDFMPELLRGQLLMSRSQ